MKYISTRTQAPAVTFDEALRQGLAPDGGLYIPERFPVLHQHDFSETLSFAEFGVRLLTPFLDAPECLKPLKAACAHAFSFPIPVVDLTAETAVLELFHGPTAAFKDVGARFLAEYISRRSDSAPLAGGPRKKRTVLVATSGDTGGAVAGAFFDRPGFEVFVLYPKGKISERQEKQIAGWGGNVHAFAVRGDFDDCQRIVKQALNDVSLRSQREFISANSISIGRLLPQMVYYAKASLDYRKKSGEKPGFIVPTGNLGNAVAALWAKKLGFPIANIILATNSNRAISEYLASGHWQPKPTVATLANAMDVGNPSNIERLLALYPDFKHLQREVSTFAVDDAEISNVIRDGEGKWRQAWCPHTATAVAALERHAPPGNWILVATAHPAKFETIVEPLIGRTIELPPALADLFGRDCKTREIDATFSAFRDCCA